MSGTEEKKPIAKWDEVAKHALRDAATHPWRWIYVKWCAGYPLWDQSTGTWSEKVRRGWNAYAKKDGVPDATFEAWANRMVAERAAHGVTREELMCADCSGFVCWCIDHNMGTAYGTEEFAKMPMSGVNKQDSLTNGPAGQILFKPGHCGCDGGFGVSISMENWSHKRPAGEPDMKLAAINEYPWEYGVKFESKYYFVDYTGADAH